MKTIKSVLSAVTFLAVIFCISLTLSADFSVKTVKADGLLNENMFDVSLDYTSNESDGSGGYNNRYLFAIVKNEDNIGTALAEYEIFYSWSFIYGINGKSAENSEDMRGYFSVAVPKAEDVDAVNTLMVTVLLKKSGEHADSLRLPVKKYKNGAAYIEQPEIDLPVPVLTENNIVIRNEYEIVGQNGVYTFFLEYTGENLNENYSLKADYYFDGDMYSEADTVKMNTVIDPEKTHTLRLKAYIVRNSDNSVVSSVELPEIYYKDGKVLQNYDGAKNNDDDDGWLRMPLIPIIALILLILYIIYCKKGKSLVTMDVVIDRLSHISGLKGTAEDILNNQKLNEKAKLKKMHKLYAEIKMELNGTVGIMKTFSDEANMGDNTKFAFDKVSGALVFVLGNYKKMSLEETAEKINNLIDLHIDPAIVICRQVVVTNNKYIKKMSGKRM